MLEVELKSVVDDVAMRRALVERAGATLTFEGRLEDRRYDSAERALESRDEVLRVRIYRSADSVRAEVDWKGPTRHDQGYKLREEIGTEARDGEVMALILERLGFSVTSSIDREIAQFTLGGAIVRFERYPRMDDLVEVEGTPEQIERAIEVLGMPRSGFTADRLPDFVMRYEARTGERGAVSDEELSANG